MILRNNFISYLATIFLALSLVILPTQIAFANEESDKHYYQGWNYYNSGKYEEAIKEYNLAISIEGKPVYYNNRGWAYYYLKNYDEALKDFLKSIELDKSNQNPVRGVARVYLVKGNNEEAKRYFVESAKKSYDSQEYEDAIDDFNDAIKLGAEDAEIYDLRGWAYYHLEKYDEAVDDFGKVIKLNNNKTAVADAYEGRASVYLKQESKKKRIQQRKIFMILERHISL